MWFSRYMRDAIRSVHNGMENNVESLLSKGVLYFIV